MVVISDECSVFDTAMIFTLLCRTELPLLEKSTFCSQSPIPVLLTKIQAMTISEVKNDLHRLVVETDDAKILNQVIAIFIALRENRDDADWWSIISEKEKMLIQRGMQQLAEGQRIPHLIVRQEINQLLGRSTAHV
jgi:hypothetical protein